MKGSADMKEKTLNESGSAVAARKRTQKNGKAKTGANVAPPPAPVRAQTPNDESRMLLEALTHLRQGDSSVRLPVDLAGLDGKVADTLNEILDLNQKMASEFGRISRAVPVDTAGWARPCASASSASCACPISSA